MDRERKTLGKVERKGKRETTTEVNVKGETSERKNREMEGRIHEWDQHGKIMHFHYDTANFRRINAVELFIAALPDVVVSI